MKSDFLEHSETQVFYMVYSPEGGAPTMQHYSYSDAKQEAERLARKHPGRQFYLLESKHLMKAETPVKITEMKGVI